MIETNNRQIGLVYFMRIPIKKIMLGTTMIWGLIRSCFGSGTWVSESNWSDSELWKNQ